MPNWTANLLTIRGSQSEVAAFLAKAKSGKSDFSFGAFLPQPEGLYQGAVGHDSPKFNWYNWNSENWGTKWDACDVDIQAGDTSVLLQLAAAAEDTEPTSEAIIRFNSAWSHPAPVLEAICYQHPELNITCDFHHEGGSGGGTIFLKDGVVIEHDYPEGSEESRQLSIKCYGFDPWGFCENCEDEDLDEAGGGDTPAPGATYCAACRTAGLCT